METGLSVIREIVPIVEQLALRNIDGATSQQVEAIIKSEIQNFEYCAYFNPKIMECAPITIKQAFRNVIMKNLSFDPDLKLVHLTTRQFNTGKKVERKVDTAIVAVASPKDTATSKVTVENSDKPNPSSEVHQDLTPTKADSVPPRQFIDVQVKKMKQLLPVELYFHNDEPECCNLRDTTALDYKQTYEAYSALENEYRREFSKGLKGADKVAAESQVNELFSKEVDKGFYDLVAFSAQLLDVVKAGNKIEITIKGYCSPLHLNDYNMKLGYRRVASLRNYFFHYRDGALLPFIANGTLVLKSESLGKETAPKTVSDKLEDTRNSVYSPAAALERRVEIVSVELK